MIETVIAPKWADEIAAGSVVSSVSTANLCSWFAVKKFINEQNPLGRHPFNILTEEIYGDLPQ